jgi:hypothetical protein
MAKDPTNEKAKGCPVGGPFFVDGHLASQRAATVDERTVFLCQWQFGRDELSA